MSIKVAKIKRSAIPNAPERGSLSRVSKALDAKVPETHG